MAIMDIPYEFYTNEKGAQMVRLNGEDLPCIIKTVAKQDTDEAFAGLCTVQITVLAKVKIPPIE